MTNELQYTISALAEEFDVSQRTIRFYEEKGLISPSRTPGNQRTYSKEDRIRLKLILRGKRFGLALDDIAEILGIMETDMSEAEQIRKALPYGQKYLINLREQIEELQLLEQELSSLHNKFAQRLKELEQD